MCTRHADVESTGQVKKSQRRAIYSHYKRGNKLCCADGLKFLKTILPKKAAIEFNDWASDSIGCATDLSNDTKIHWELSLLRKLIES